MRQKIFLVDGQNALTLLERHVIPDENSLRKDLRILDPGTGVRLETAKSDVFPDFRFRCGSLGGFGHDANKG